MMNKLVEVYDVLMVTDAYKKKLRTDQEINGIYRSGEGTEAEIIAKI